MAETSISVRPLVSVVTSALNERDNVARLVREVFASFDGLDVDVELIVVDDGSSDGTADAVFGLQQADPRIGLVQLSRNFGQQAGILAGLDHARGDAAIVMDADLQHPPRLIPELVSQWRAGAQVVQCVRADEPSQGLVKRVTSRFFYWLMGKLAQTSITPHAPDFFLIDRAALDALLSCRERMRFNRGLLSWIGFRRVLVPFRPDSRHAGIAKYNLKRELRLATDAVLSFSVTPLRIMGLVGVALTFVTALYLIYVVIVRLFTSSAVSGWASTVAVVTLLGGGQMVMLWLVGEYIAMIAENARGRPPYIVLRSVLPGSQGPDEPGH